jgi:hypothetical protein
MTGEKHQKQTAHLLVSHRRKPAPLLGFGGSSFFARAFLEGKWLLFASFLQESTLICCVPSGSMVFL